MSMPEVVFPGKPSGIPIVVYVSPRYFHEGARYCIARRYDDSTVVYDDLDYTTAFAAYVAAATEAIRLHVRLDAPVFMKSRLIAFWYRRGAYLFRSDQPRAFCTNKYERRGYDLAEEKFTNPVYEAYEGEKESKPGLTDCVTIAVRPGEYGRQRATKGKKVAA